MFSALAANQAIEYPLVVKADTQGTVEAITQSINKISTDLIRARILHSGVGGITESDVTLAGASGAPIIGFNVRPNAKAREIADRHDATIVDMWRMRDIEIAGVMDTDRMHLNTHGHTHMAHAVLEAIGVEHGLEDVVFGHAVGGRDRDDALAVEVVAVTATTTAATIVIVVVGVIRSISSSPTHLENSQIG